MTSAGKAPAASVDIKFALACVAAKMVLVDAEKVQIVAAKNFGVVL